MAWNMKGSEVVHHTAASYSARLTAFSLFGRCARVTLTGCCSGRERARAFIWNKAGGRVVVRAPSSCQSFGRLRSARTSRAAAACEPTTWRKAACGKHSTLPPPPPANPSSPQSVSPTFYYSQITTRPQTKHGSISVMAELQDLVERLEKSVKRLELASLKIPGVMSPVSDAVNGDNGVQDLAPYVEAFDVVLAGPVADFMKHSKILGEDVEKHAEIFSSAFEAQRDFLAMACKRQHPLEAPKPGPYVKEMYDAATFYTNRVLKEYKENDKRHVEWVKSFLSIWTELQAYIKEYHTTGLLWNKVGLAKSPPSCGPCPLPPPPPPPGPPPTLWPETSKDEASVARSQLFAQLNQGEGITKGLRHVPDDQKTHKNPSLRPRTAVINSPSKSHSSSPTSPMSSPQQPRMPVLELEGKKWKVEYQENNDNIVISEAELKHVVYVYKCSNSTLKIQGKVNSITIDSCKKLGLVFDNVVGIVEIINSRDVQVQVMGKVPTISINKTEGCHIYLSEESLGCEIISAKSSEMNILIPQDDDYKEYPVPEQFKTIWNGSKLFTEAAENVG
ncbi:adenylyl cyclase-associated protein 2 isoform X3 [Chiloscyllium punctatum]|uniref:adenylyl cyclase-associated protein 2 isoform X3 n=1 Tax=Chiloscyllium punctatum TaxID=137246 RepID=UPI003B63CE49